MTASSPPPGVTVATVLRDLADSRALDLELLAGADGLGRHITIPHTQKTGLALSGFDAYLRGGRVLVFGESEVRYLESLDPAARTAVAPPRPQPRPAVPPRHRRLRAAAGARRSKPTARTCRCCARASPRPKRCPGCRRSSTPISPRAASSTAS